MTFKSTLDSRVHTTSVNESMAPLLKCHEAVYQPKLIGYQKPQIAQSHGQDLSFYFRKPLIIIDCYLLYKLRKFYTWIKIDNVSVRRNIIRTRKQSRC